MSVSVKEKCAFCNSYTTNKSKKYGNIWICSKHRRQLDLYGEVKERTKFDKNKIIIEEEFARIEMYDKNHHVVAEAIIDSSDVPKVEPFKWNLSKGYVVTKQGDKHIKLHRIIMSDYLDVDKEVDHINRNKLDNRKCNLRIVSHYENMQNLGQNKRNSTGEKGIYYIKSKNRYRVDYRQGDKIHKKMFQTFDEAKQFKESLR